jgi:FdhD protein
MTVMSRPPSPLRHPTVESVAVHRWKDGRVAAASDMAAAEVPVCLEFNGISHAVMLASPSDLEDFALGFSLTEGIIDHPGDIRDLELEECRDGITVRLSIASARFHRLKQRRRSMTGRTGCGLCGAESLSQVFRDIPPVASTALVGASALQAAFTDLAAHQPMQRLTGATHAAAWAMPDGRLAMIREDVGRHNALDKLMGAMASTGLDMGMGAVVVTSRASYEMVQKTATMGIGILAAISAPTMLAIRMAEALNLTLVGFARHNSHVLYAGADRILPEVSP